MTAPDAPQVEPLTLTLEEALQRLYVKGLTLIPPGDGTDSWGIGVAGDSPDEEFDTWHEAVSAVLGVPVVPRDDTAELVEALERVTRGALWDDLVDRWLVQPEAMERVRAALARVKGGELGEGWGEPYAHRDPGNGRPARTARNTRGER